MCLLVSFRAFYSADMRMASIVPSNSQQEREFGIFPKMLNYSFQQKMFEIRSNKLFEI